MSGTNDKSLRNDDKLAQNKFAEQARWRCQKERGHKCLDEGSGVIQNMYQPDVFIGHSRYLAVEPVDSSRRTGAPYPS